MKQLESENITVTVPSEMAGWRVDRVLSRLLDGWSRRDIGDLVSRKAVKVGENIVAKGTSKVHGGQTITINSAVIENIKQEVETRRNVQDFGYTGDVSAVVPEDIPLNIVYEDEDVLVVDKPAGMVIHPAYANTSGTLANAVAGYFKNKGIKVVKRIGLVHRLDKEVSGLVIIAKTDKSLEYLSTQFSSEGISHTYLNVDYKAWKYYRALVEERFERALTQSGLKHDVPVLVEGWVGRSENDRKKYVFYPYGIDRVRSQPVKYAASWMTLKNVDSAGIELEIQIITGRTHQIRTQLAALGLPIIGDGVYGVSKGKMKLRCEKISFIPAWRMDRRSFQDKLNNEVGISAWKNIERITVERVNIWNE